MKPIGLNILEGRGLELIFRDGPAGRISIVFISTNRLAEANPDVGAWLDAFAGIQRCLLAAAERVKGTL